MRKRGKKLVAMALATSMALGTVSMQAFANEPVIATESNAIENADGTTTEQTITTTTTTNPETGNVMVEVKIEETTDDTDIDGNIIDRDESSVEKTETDKDGKVVESTLNETMKEVITSEDGTVTTTEMTVESGYESTYADTIEPGQMKDDWKEKTDVTVGVGQDDPETPEDESIVKESIHETFTDGDKKKDENDPEYNYTETTIDREVTAEIGEGQITSEQFSDTGLKPVGPEDYEGKSHILVPGSGDTAPNYGQTANKDCPDNSGKYHKYEKKDDSGAVIEVSWYPISNRTEDEYALLPDEIKNNYTFDEVNSLWKPTGGEKYAALENEVWWDYIFGSNGEESTAGEAVANNHYHPNSHFVLYDKAGNRAYAYCMDAIIGTNTGVKYSVENLEDADYFKGELKDQEEAKAHVRAIALNGYWGTKEGTGSLKKLKEDLIAALDNGFVFDYTYTEHGVTYDYDSSTEEGKQKVLDMLVEYLNEGEALCATQGAFWSFGRENNNFLGFNPYRKNSDNGMYGGGAELRMTLIWDYLTSDYLKDKVAADEEAKESTIIDMDSFLKDNGLELTVGDKVVDVEENNNDKDNDDVYNVDITFAMVVEPSTENGDDLVVKLIGSDGSVIRQARLAGDSSNDEGFSSIKKNGNGSYTFENLHLAENSDFTFDLKVEGIQKLEQGVYIYKATAGYDKNQTLVGLSAGEKEVSISQNFTVSFNVEESITTEYYWRDEDKKVIVVNPKPTTPDGNDDDGNDGGSSTPSDPNPVTPQVAVETFEIEESEVPLSDGVSVLGAFEIEDDMIPLGVLPATGDNSLWLMIVSLFSGLSLAGASFVDKMKKRRR